MLGEGRGRAGEPLQEHGMACESSLKARKGCRGSLRI